MKKAAVTHGESIFIVLRLSWVFLFLVIMKRGWRFLHLQTDTKELFSIKGQTAHIKLGPTKSKTICCT